MAAATGISFKDLCIDAVNPEVLATFWASALGLRAEPSSDDFRLVDDVPEHTLWVNKVPEPRAVKQRVHLDVDVSAVSDLTDLGAVIIDETQSWTVLADPEGGELGGRRPVGISLNLPADVCALGSEHRIASAYLQQFLDAAV